MAMRAEAQAASELWDRIRETVEGLGPDDWSRPTPCERWDVHDLVAHLPAVQTLFDGSAEQPPTPEGWEPDPGLSPIDTWTEAGVVARRGWTPAQLLDEIAVARAGHLARLEAADPAGQCQGPLGKTTEEVLFRTRMLDLWIHVQDLALALNGKPDTADASAAARATWDTMLSRVPALSVKRAGAVDGQRLRLVIDEPLGFDRVLAVEDGRAGWTDGDAPERDATPLVRAHPVGFALLVTGRGSPEEWRDAGLLEWRGDLAEAFVRRARIFGA